MQARLHWLNLQYSLTESSFSVTRLLKLSGLLSEQKFPTPLVSILASPTSMLTCNRHLLTDTSTSPIPWMNKSSNCSLLTLASLFSSSLRQIGIPAQRIASLAQKLFLPLFIYLHLSLGIPILISLGHKNSFRYWNFYITSNPPLFFHFQAAKIL